MIHALLLASLIAAPEPAAAQVITAACGVRVRAEPGSAGKEITRLGVGVVVDVDGQRDVPGTKGQADTWLRVKEPAGWVSRSLVRPFNVARKWDVLVELANDRVRVEDAPFEDGMDTVDFLDRALADNPPDEARGVLQLARLRVMARTTERFPQEPNASARKWLKRAGEDVMFDELGGGWMVPHHRFWKLFEAHRGKPWSEPMAFHASNAAVPGECEGIAACIIDRSTRTRGRYLQEFPTGAHAQDVLLAIRGDLRGGVPDTSIASMEPGDVPMTVEAVPPLKRIVDATNAPARADVLKELARIERGLKKLGSPASH